VLFRSSDISFTWLYLLIKFTDGENDGLCPVESAKWAGFKGVITSGGHFGISHSGIIDFYRVAYRGVDIPRFYVDIARELEHSRLP
jgi:triacylglycerol esterase/lipase EstA (alpha/beta hydrolase family)